MRKLLLSLCSGVAALVLLAASSAKAQLGTGTPPNRAEKTLALPAQSYAVVDVSQTATDASLFPLVAASDDAAVAFCYYAGTGSATVLRWKDGQVSTVQTVPGTRTDTGADGSTTVHRYAINCLDASGNAYGQDVAITTRLAQPPDAGSSSESDAGLIASGGQLASVAFNDGCYYSCAVAITVANNAGGYFGYGSGYADNSLFTYSKNTALGYYHWVCAGAGTAAFDPWYADLISPAPYPGTSDIFYSDNIYSGAPARLNDKGWLAGNPSGGAGLWDGARMLRCPVLGGSWDWVADLDNEGHVVGHSPDGTDDWLGWIMTRVADGQGNGSFAAVQPFADLVPPPLRGEIKGIDPSIVSNEKSATDHRYRVLASARVLAGDNPAAWADAEVVWTCDPSQPEGRQWTFARVQVPDNVSIYSYEAMTPDGVLTAIGCPDTSVSNPAYNHVLLLVPIMSKVLSPSAGQQDTNTLSATPADVTASSNGVVVAGMAPVPKPQDGEDAGSVSFIARRNAYFQQQVPDASIAYIEPHAGPNSSPQMPELIAQLPPSLLGAKVRWKLKVSYLRGNGWRSSYFTDYFDGTPSAEDVVEIPQDYTSEMDAAQPWQIFQEPSWISTVASNGFFGGTAELYVWMTGNNAPRPTEPVMTFRIGGKNPDPALAKTFIQNHLCDARLWFAYAIAKKESVGYGDQNHRFYNQFFGSYRKPNANGPGFDQNKDWQCWAKGWPTYNIDRVNGPRITSAGGYGIFQVTGDAQTQWTSIPRRQIWNWQDNAGYQVGNVWFGAMGILKAKIQVVDARYNALQQTHLECGAIGSYPQNGATAHKLFSGWDAYTCKAYNGFGGTEPQIPINGFKSKQWSVWHPNGQQWTFVDDGYTLDVWNKVEENN